MFGSAGSSPVIDIKSWSETTPGTAPEKTCGASATDFETARGTAAS